MANKGTSQLAQQPLGMFCLIVAGASLLSFMGGFINGIAVGQFKTGLTHLTGTTTYAGVTITEPQLKASNPPSFWWMLILTYAAGSCISGLIVGGARTKWGGLQATVISLEAMALWLAVIIFPRVQNLSAALIALASGLQNGSTGNLEVIVLRTANVTGTVVDIGLALGQCLREGFAKHRWKLGLWVPCYLCFWLGAMGGGSAWVGLGENALVVASCMVSSVAIVSWGMAHRNHLSKKMQAPMVATDSRADGYKGKELQAALLGEGASQPA